jgi:hypothetical protein
VIIKRKPSFMRNAMSGLGEAVVKRPPWELIAIVALGVAALANVMLYVGRKMDQKAS